MKWTNPGHQLDDLGKKYLKVENLYIYGTSEMAKQAYDFLCWLGVADEFDISFVLDIPEGSAETFCGRPVIALQTDFRKEISSAPEKVAVALSWYTETCPREISEQAGVTNIFYLANSNGRHDNFIQHFICVWLMYKHGKLLSHWTNFRTTGRCNLNCRDCLNFNNLITEPKDVTFEEFKEHIDTVFSKFDYLYSLHFTGGEPMLVKELPHMIRYLGEKYGNRIFDFFVITNGTMIPSEEVIDAVKSVGGHFLIDDYSETVSRTKVGEIKSALDSHNVKYTVNKTPSWFQLDVENTDNSEMSDEELEKYKDGCNTFLCDFGEKKIYACCWQKYAECAGIGKLEENDYIEIASTPKMEILEFRQGYTKKGYVDLCKHCKGIGGSAQMVPAALQIPKRVRSESGISFGVNNLVSVCVPVYNTDAKYLERCIRSLQAQTCGSLEIILVDDGSTDESGTICDKYAAADPRIKVIHKANGGEASARNEGLRAAQGEFVMFCDSDDEYLPNSVQLLVDGIKADGADLAIGGYLERHKDSERFATAHFRSLVSAEVARTALVEGCAYGAVYILSTVNSKLFRRELIVNNRLAFDERLVVGNDSIFVSEYLSCAKTVYNVCAPLYIYYKYEPGERVQGMGWYYPDAFFLNVSVADKMVKIAKLELEEFNRFVMQAYQNWIYGAINAAANEEYFENGMTPHLAASCRIDLLWIAANLDLANCDTGPDPFIPGKQISYLVKNKRCQELRRLFLAIAQARGIAPHKGKYVRQMVRLGVDAEAQRENPAPEQGESALRRQFKYAADLGWISHVNSLVMTVVADGAAADVYEERIAALEETWKPEPPEIEQLRAAIQAGEAENQRLTAVIQTIDTENQRLAAVIQANETTIQANEATIQASEVEKAQLRAIIQANETQIEQLKAAIQVYENSTIWRMTKPLRVVLDYIKGLRKRNI